MSNSFSNSEEIRAKLIENGVDTDTFLSHLEEASLAWLKLMKQPLTPEQKARIRARAREVLGAQTTEHS